MILLIQFRTDQSGWHEVKCIFDSAKLPYDQFRTINATSNGIRVNEILELIDKSGGVIIGGLGEMGYEEKDQKKKKIFESLLVKMDPVIRKLVKEDIPTLGLCFGHQLIADILGSEISLSKEFAETGANKIYLTEEGKTDPIFKGIKSEFIAIEGHKATVVDLPKGAIHLAYSDKCKIQGYRIGKHIYGLQFHSELDFDDLEYRLSLYPEYRENSLSFKTQEALKVKNIIQNFTDIVNA